MQKIVLLAVVLTLSGCAKVAHLPQLLTLKSIGDNKGEQEKFVNQQKAAYEKALEAYKTNTLGNYPDTKSILKNLGQPLLVKNITRNQEPRQRWLYRHPVKAFKSEKVYLYFDASGKLVEWEHVDAPAAKEPSHEAQQSI